MTTLPTSDPFVRSIYTGRTTSWPMVAATCAGAALLVVMAGGGRGTSAELVVPVAVVAVGVLGNVLTASSVRATAGPNGFTVHWGIIGWPRGTYRIDQIERAEVVDLPWWRVSWGWWWTPTRTSCTVRSGPTVRVVLHTGRVVTVTVPDPEAAVAAIQEAKQHDGTT